MLQHRHFALLVDLITPALLASLAVEEIDEHRLPGLAGEFEHEGSFIGIAGFGEAVQFVVGHGGPSFSQGRWRCWWGSQMGRQAEQTTPARHGQCNTRKVE
ncbi:hypothetical protein D3C73_1119580 [compost metagenome]